MKARQDNNMIDHTSTVYIENEIKLPCPIGLGVVFDKNKTGQQQDQSLGLVYIETKIELSGPIWSGEVYEENHTRQQHDQSYKCNLHQKWNRSIVSDRIEYGLW